MVLIPSGTKSGKVFSQKPVNGDGDFTFSRSTAATRVNADGNIEKETSNLLLQSNTFSNAVWAGASTTETGGQSGYDGTNDAWLLSKLVANGNIAQSVSASNLMTFSVYAKASANAWLRLNVVGVANAYFDLANGVVGSTGGSAAVTSSMSDVGSGWYRCSFTYNVASTTGVSIYVADADNDSSGTSGSIFIQDAQLEQGLVARDYIETTTAAVEGGITDNVPRLDYTDSSCPALLLEPQRSNLFAQSEYYSDSYWSKTLVSFTDNYATSPEGVQNASRFVSAGGSYPQLGKSISGLTIGQTYTASFYVKSDGTSQIQHTSWFTGFAGTTFTATDEWQRISFSITATATTHSFVLFNNSPSAPASSFLLYGLQLEAGSYATSYIPTYGTSVTRNNETLQLTGMSSDVASGATSGTLMIEFDYTQQSLGDVVQWYSSNTAIGRGYLYNRSLGFADTWGSAGLGTTDGVNTKVIWRLDSLSSGTFFKDGVKGNDVDTTTQAWNNIDNLYIRGHYGTLNIRQIIFVPTALSNEEAIDLTTL